LLTCPTNTDSVPFAQLDETTRLCVIVAESEEGRQVAEFIINNRKDGGAMIVHTTKQEIVLASNDFDYPVMCDKDIFMGLSTNAVRHVISVARFPYQPRTYVPSDHPVYNLSAPNPVISNAIKMVSSSHLQNNDYILSTDYWTRNSQAIGTKCPSGRQCADLAVTHVVNQFKSLLSGHPSNPTVSTYQFRTDYCHDVIAEIPGTTKPGSVFILGAHLDNRMEVRTDTTSRAPGGDDNTSGVAALLEIARIIGSLKQKFTFTIRLITFCGEEQGLYGSQALATQYVNAKASILGMWNLDMIGWVDSKYGVTVTFDADKVTSSFTADSKTVVKTYISSAVIGSATGCCSDQQPFYEAGYPTASFFETPTNTVVYPYYHKTTDTYDKINYNQVALVTQAALAVVMEYDIPA